MRTATRFALQGHCAAKKTPAFIYHSAFEEPEGEHLFSELPANNDNEPFGFMPDDITRDLAKRMHYAAWRAYEAATQREAAHWHRLHYDHRDRIVLGNRKLTYRAVHKWGSVSQCADDMVGECQIVLIKAVVAFNPWLGIRFSTYAFTCLMRALSRLAQRQAADRLFRSVPTEALADGEPMYVDHDESADPRLTWVGEYLRGEGTLLTTREKLVLTRRFPLNDETPRNETLEQVGRDLGLSKERVRQLQKSALGKLRDALLSRPLMA